MKKVLFVALAAVGLTACVANESVKMAGTDAISFSTYINTPSRTANPTTTTDNIQNFDVWAFMDEYTGTVLVDEDVTKSSSGWGYSNIQYWTPNHTYYFAALSPMNTANITSKTLATGDDAKLGLGEIAYSNPAGTEDLLYTVAMAQTPDFATLTANGMLPVSLQFKHLLSKVKFTFKNSFRTDNVTIKVTDVEMKVAETASINLAATDYSKNWVNLAGETTLDFGDVDVLSIGQSAATENERLTIPALATDAKAVYNITFNVELYNGDVLAHTYPKEATISGYELVMGKAYNFTAEITPATLGLEPIEFTVTVKPWDQEIVTPLGTLASSAADLTAALADPETSAVILADNVDYGTINLGELNGVTIYGGEDTFMRLVTDATSKLENVTIKDVDFAFVTGSNQKAGAFFVIDSAAQIDNLVIEGCTLVGDGKKNSYGIYGQNTGASIVVKDCSFSNLGYAIQATGGGGYKSLVVENCVFEGIVSWAILPQYGYTGDLTIDGCTFNNTNGGLLKTGTFSGAALNFTNNTITNSVGHDGKDTKWFEVDASTATKVISGNTKNGAAWTPGAAEGLK